jgi:N-acetylmuramoyl-L-alanine amidase
LLRISHEYQSPNHEPRTGAPIALIVLHATVGSLVSARGWLCNPASKASTHYLIGKAGDIYQLVSEDRAAWHAGRSAYGSLDSEAIKDRSIGIELENANDGRDPYPIAQIDALRSLMRDLLTRHPAAQLVTHAQIATPQGRKTDPLGFPLESFRASLVTAPLIPHGFVLTSARNAPALSQSLTIGRYPLLVCVTAWGLRWDDTSRMAVAAMTERLVVRTEAGDPTTAHPYPNHERVIAEIAPWAVLRPTLDVVIGNEPNVKADIDPAGYAWHLDRAITEIRTRFPAARITSPALIADDRARAWANTPQWRAAIARCDAYGAHVYAHHHLATGDAAYDAQTAINRATIPPDKPWAYSEYGIHDPNTTDAEKARRYRAWLQTHAPHRVAWAAAYHLCHNPLDADQRAYAIGPGGLAVYGAA